MVGGLVAGVRYYEKHADRRNSSDGLNHSIRPGKGILIPEDIIIELHFVLVKTPMSSELKSSSPWHAYFFSISFAPV